MEFIKPLIYISEHISEGECGTVVTDGVGSHFPFSTVNKLIVNFALFHNHRLPRSLWLIHLGKG